MKKDHSSRYSKPLLAALLIGLVLLLDAMAAAPALHELLHQDADQASHQCAVTLFSHGKVDSAGPVVSDVAPTIVVEPVPSLDLTVFSETVKHLPPGRAPPAIVSPLV